MANAAKKITESKKIDTEDIGVEGLQKFSRDRASLSWKKKKGLSYGN